MLEAANDVPRAAKTKKMRDPEIYRFDGPIEPVRPSFTLMLGRAASSD